MATPNIVPRADSEGGVGTASKYWASAYIDLIYVGAGKMGRDADNLIDFSSDNQFTFRVGGNNELIIDGSQIYPATNDGMALGYPTVGFSDLFLASGAVVNFDNGNVTLTHSTNALTLADGDALHFGTDNDLRLFHTSGESLVQNTVGHLYIQNTADDKDIIFSSDDGSGGVTAYLTLDGSATNIKVAKDMRFNDNVEAEFGTGGDFKIYHDGSNTYLEQINAGTGNIVISNANDDGDIIFKSDDGSGGTTEYIRIDGGQTRTEFAKATQHEDNVIANFGSSSDMQIYHNGTDSYILNGTGDLEIISNKQDKDTIFKGDDGQASDNTVATYFYLDGSSAAHNGSATTALYTNWPDNSRISLGTSHDLTIHHSGTSSAFANAVGHLEFIQSADGSDIKFYCDDGSSGIAEYLRLDGGDQKINVSCTNGMQFNDNVRIKVGSGTGGDLRVYHDGSNTFFDNNVGDVYYRQYKADGDMYFQCDDGSGSGVANYFYLDGGEGHTVVTKEMHFQDAVVARFGADDDAQIVHSGSSLSMVNQTGNFNIVQNADDGDIIFQASTGSAAAATYIALDGGIAKTTVHRPLKFDDNISAEYGTGTDMIMYHSGSNGSIENYTGNLTITNNNDDGDILFKSDDGSGGITAYLTLDGGTTRVEVDVEMGINTPAAYTAHANANDLVIGNGSGSQGLTIYSGDSNSGSIYFADDLDEEGSSDNPAGNRDAVIQYSHNNSEFNFSTGGNQQALELKNSSATFAGDVNLADSKKIQLGGSQDLQMYHDGSNSYIDAVSGDTGNLFIRNTVDDGDIYFQSDNGAGGVDHYFFLDGSQATHDGSSYTSLITNWRDNSKIALGSSRDLLIYHDGSNSYIDETGTGVLKIRGDNQIQFAAPTGGEVYAVFNKDGACEFRHNDSTKLATTSTGVSVTGAVSATSYKTGSTTVLQGDADVILGSSGGTGTISLTTHTSVPFKIENDDSISMSPAKIVMTNLPTSDPGTTGQLWNDNGTLKISAGG